MRCNAICLAMTLGLPALALGQTSYTFPNDIPQEHPRLYWNAERLAQARAWYAQHPFDPSTNTNVEQSNETQPLDNAFKYLMTGEESYCAVAHEWASSALPSIPVEGSTGCSECRWYGNELILVYDWCHDALTEAERSEYDRLTDMLVHWNDDFWGSHVPYGDGDVPFSENNYFWGYLRNNLMWGIATFHENVLAQSFIDNAIRLRWEGVVLPHFNECNGTGIPFEGTDYGNYMEDYFHFAFVSAGLLGRDMISETRYWEGAVFNYIYNMPSGLTYANPTAPEPRWSTFPYGDSQDFINDIAGGAYWDIGPAQRPNLAEFMTLMASRHDGDDLARYARRYVNITKQGVPGLYVRRAVAAIDPGTEDKDFANLPLDYYGADRCIAQAYARSGWTAEDTAVHLQLIAPEGLGHEHEDTGNWQMWRKGRWVALEAPGRAQSEFDVPAYGGADAEVRTDVASTLGHNVLMFAGNGLATLLMDYAVLRRLESQPSYFYAVSDVTGAYLMRDGETDEENRYYNPAVGHAEREFLFVRPFEALVIFDRMQSVGTDLRKAFLVHAQAPFVLSGTNRHVAQNGDQALSLTTVLPPSPTFRPINEKYPNRDNGDAGYQSYRIEVETSAAAEEYFLHVAQARDANTANLGVEFTETADTYNLTLTHPQRGCARVVLQKGMVSEGGQFGYAQSCDAVTLTALTEVVARIDVTDDGPVWDGQADSAPVFTTTAPPLAGLGVPYTYDVNAIGVPTPKYRLTAGPAGMTIDANSGMITWPNPSPLGPVTGTVVASNLAGEVTQNFAVTVVEPSELPDDPQDPGNTDNARPGAVRSGCGCNGASVGSSGLLTALLGLSGLFSRRRKLA